MSFKTELIAFAVRVLADNTNLVRKPDAFETLLTDFFGQESYDRQMAKNIEVEAARAASAVKRIRTNQKFKKIVNHV